MYCQSVAWGVRNARALPVRRRWGLPVRADGIPAVAQALLVGVAVLGNDRGDPFRVPHRDPEARRRTVVEDVNREPVEADDLGEPPHHSGDMVERVLELVARRHRRPAKAGEVGSDDVKTVGQARNEISEHVARAGKAVK